jgi:2-polyprenyl-6-methoxyphenol hydroxylase-like FAD-dependent oxidoreductase
MASQRAASIVGASVAGLATGCALAARGWTVTLLERRPDLLESGRAILLQPNGLAALQRLGALDQVLERGTRLTRVVFYGRRFRPIAAWDYTQLRHPHPYAVEIRPPGIRAALAERLAGLRGESLRCGCEVVGLAGEPDGVTGSRYRDQAGDEHELEGACVVGADGPDSSVRAALGIDITELAARDRYVLGTVEVDGSGDEAAIYLGAGYGDGVVPLGDGTYFWDRVTAENSAAVEARDLAGWREVYEKRVPPGSEIPRAVTSWEQLTLVHVRPFWARDQIADGAALVGDAAGVVHPHSAQGANLALEDAVALGDVLGGYSGGEPVPRSLLGAYAAPRLRRRRRFVLQSLLAAGFMDAPNPIWRAFRGVNLAGSRVGPGRRAFLRVGIG